MRHARLVIVAFAASLSACASDYGGSISGKDVLSPQERRLQAVEGNVAVLQRRLDAVNLTGMDQQNQHLRDDVRSLRGDVEKMRYDLDQQKQHDQDIEARLQRLEGGAVLPPQPGYGPAAAPAAGASMPAAPAMAAPSASGYAAPATPPSTRVPGSSNSIPVTTAVQTPSAPSGTTLSQGSGPSPDEEAAYLAAFESLKNGKYDDALKGFHSQLQQWPQGQFADNALYWSGEAYYVKQDYKSALAAFQAVLQRFPRSAKTPDAMLKSGLVQMDLNQDAEGRASLQRVIRSYPGTNAAQLAQQRLAPGKK